jgi:hypothetical protein
MIKIMYLLFYFVIILWAVRGWVEFSKACHRLKAVRSHYSDASELVTHHPWLNKRVKRTLSPTLLQRLRALPGQTERGVVFSACGRRPPHLPDYVPVDYVVLTHDGKVRGASPKGDGWELDLD